MSLPIPSWLGRLLGVNTESGEGVAWGIEFVWGWPPWATLLLGAFVVAFVTAIYWHENRRGSQRYRMLLAALRLASIAIVLLMIAQLTLSLKRTGLPYAVVVIDDSQSMATVDQYDAKPAKAMGSRMKHAGIEGEDLSRWNLARTLLIDNRARFLRSLADGHKLRLYYLTGPRSSDKQDVSDMIEELRSSWPQGEQTRLGSGIRDVLDELRGATPTGVVVLSDGVNTDGPPLSEAAEYARRRGVPLFMVGLGSEQPPCDVKLSDLLVDDVVFVDDVVNFECKLSASGFRGQKIPVVLREKGKPDVLAKTEVSIESDDQSQQVRIPYRPTQVGQFEYVVEVEPRKGETQTENNRQSKVVQVRKEKIRVLLVQAYPNFEFRYLRNMLRRDETISLSTVLQESDVEHVEQDTSALKAFPLKRSELFGYDVVIFGDVNPGLLGSAALQNLAEFVEQPEKGGALVVIAGPEYMPSAYGSTPLGRLLPFAAETAKRPDPSKTLREGFVVQPTDLGLASPSMQLGDTPEETAKIWHELAPLYWLLEVPRLKQGVRVLAEHPTRVGPDGRHLPVFCFQYVGAGKVLFHATDETWRWRYRAGDAYFARYWVQTIRYLCRAKLADAGRTVLLSADRREYSHGESVRLRVRFADERLAPAKDDGVSVAVELSGGQRRQLTLHRTTGRGVFEGTLDRPSPGQYHVWIASPTLKEQSPSADFSVTPPAGEFARIRMDAAEMRRAAEETGGHFYTFETADRLPGDFPSGRQVPIESLPPLPLWNHWLVLVALLGLLTTEWVLRKRCSMA